MNLSFYILQGSEKDIKNLFLWFYECIEVHKL
jgi:hypothetical protein